MQRDGNAVIGRITLRHGIRVDLVRVCSSYCVYDGEMLFRTVVLSRACAEPDVLTFPSGPLAANANLNYTFFFADDEWWAELWQDCRVDANKGAFTTVERVLKLKI
jgi:hypothetical protein